MSGGSAFMTYTVRFIANANNFQQGLANAQRSMLGLQSTILAVSAGVASAMSVAAYNIRNQIASVAVAYDKALTESLAVMENVTPQIRQQVMDVTRALATDTTTSAQKAAEGFKHLALSGLDVNAALQALPIVNQFAIAGIMDMQQATDLLIDAQAALGLTLRKNGAANAAEMEHLADAFAKAATISNASIEQFSVALTSKAGAAMKLFNVSTAEGLAVLSAYAEQGIKAQLAGNAYDRALRLLSKAAISNARQQAMLGFSVFDAQGKMRNMADIVENLEDILRGLTDEQKAATLTMIGFEAKSQQVITPLIGMSKALRNYQTELENVSGYTKDVAEKNMASMAGQIEILKNRFKEFALQIADSLLPGIRQTNTVLQKLMDILLSLHPWVSAGIGLFISMAATLPAVVAGVSALMLSQNLLAFALGSTNMQLMTQLHLLGLYRRALIGLGVAGAGLAAGVAGAWIGDWLRGTKELNAELEKIQKTIDKTNTDKQLAMNAELRDIDKLGTAKEKQAAIEKQMEDARIKMRVASKQQRFHGLQVSKIAGESALSNYGFNWFGDQLFMGAGKEGEFKTQEMLVQKYADEVAMLSAQYEELAKKKKEVDDTLAAGEKANAIENMRANVPHSGYADRGFDMAETMKEYIGDLKRIPTIWEMAGKAQEKGHKLMLKMMDLGQKIADDANKAALQQNVEVEKDRLKQLKKDLEDTKRTEKEKLREHKDALREHERMIKAIKDYERDDDKLAIASRGQVMDSILKRMTVMPSAPVEPVFSGPGSSDAIKDEIAATEAAIQTAQNTKEQFMEQVKQREAFEKMGSYLSGFFTNLSIVQAAKITP